MASFSDLERMAKAICSAWPKTPDGCAAICMRIGNPLVRTGGESS
jgi:hypothetical protein